PHDLSDLLPDEVGGGIIGGLVQREVVVDGHEGQPAVLPARLISGAALVVAVVERTAIGYLGINAVPRLLARKAPDLRIVVAKFFALLGRQRRVACGNRVIRRTLKDREMLRLPGDDRHRLDAGGTGADDADAQAG